MSKKARKSISRAQKKRWAKFHAKEDAQRERWKDSSQARRDRNMKKQDPKSTSRLKGNAIREYWKRLKQNPVAYQAEVAKRTKARDANKAKGAAA